MVGGQQVAGTHSQPIAYQQPAQYQQPAAYQHPAQFQQPAVYQHPAQYPYVPPYASSPWTPNYQRPKVPRAYSKRVLLGASIGFIALIILIAGMATHSWYVATETQEDNWDDYIYVMELRFGLSGVEWVEEEWWEGNLDYTDRFTERYSDDSDVRNSDFVNVAYTTSALLWVGLLLAIIFVPMAFLSGSGFFDRSQRMVKHVHFFLGLLAFVLIIAGVLYYSATFPNAIASDDAWYDIDNYDSAGVGWGVYVTLAAGIVLLFATAMTMRLPKDVSMPSTSPAGRAIPAYADPYTSAGTDKAPVAAPSKRNGPRVGATPAPQRSTPKRPPPQKTPVSTSPSPVVEIAAPVEYTYCPACGIEMDEGEVSCPECGTLAE